MKNDRLYFRVERTDAWELIKEMDKETKKMAAQEHYRKFIKDKSKKGGVRNDNGNN